MNTVLSQYLIDEGIEVSLASLWVRPHVQRVSALCYVEQGGSVLMLRRLKEPFAGLYTAPGGKLKAGETPKDAVVRELHEETGLRLHNPRLCLITSELGYGDFYNWLLFVYRCDQFHGNVGSCNEGELRWVPMSQLTMLAIPEVDQKLLPYIFTDTKRFVAHLVYNQAHGVDSLQVQEVSPRQMQ